MKSIKENFIQYNTKSLKQVRQNMTNENDCKNHVKLKQTGFSLHLGTKLTKCLC